MNAYVWVFTGNGARFPSAVFSSRKKAEALTEVIVLYKDLEQVEATLSTGLCPDLHRGLSLQAQVVSVTQ